MRLILIICIIILSLGNTTFAQTAAEVQAHATLLTPDNAKPHYLKHISADNEFKLVFSGLFLTYKTFLSSQDSHSCNFIPSCSEYSIESIRKRGFFIGFMSTFDRLTRCNGLNPHKYPIDETSGLSFDPVH